MNRLSFVLGSAAISIVAGARSSAATAAALPKNHFIAMVVSVNGNTALVQKRNGKQLTVDLTEAAANNHVGIVAPTVLVKFHGTYNADGSFHCVFTSHAPPTVRDWDPDV